MGLHHLVPVHTCTVQITRNLYASYLHSRAINTRQSSTRDLEFEFSHSRSRVTFEFECSSIRVALEPVNTTRITEGLRVHNVGRASIRRLYKHSYRSSSYQFLVLSRGLYAARARVVLTHGRLPGPPVFLQRDPCTL